MIPVANCSEHAYARIREALGPGVRTVGVGGSLGMTVSVSTEQAARAREVIRTLIEAEGLEASLIAEASGRKARRKRRQP